MPEKNENTKQLIKDTLYELSNEMNIEKINVASLVKACGISRTIFYYYYSDIDYKKVWKSEVSGCSYPDGIHVEVPTADIVLDLTIQPGDPEFYHPENGLSGFEALRKIDGSYHGQKVDRYGFLEIIGDCCGEI